MEYPEPTIDVEAETSNLLQLAIRRAIDRAMVESPAGMSATAHLTKLLATAWEEGRWSPPGPVANPYGAALVQYPASGAAGYPGLRLLRLREAAQAALAWVTNMAPTVRRTALAEQLRAALGGGAVK